MKPYENFVENILGAVRSSQGKDPACRHRDHPGSAEVRRPDGPQRPRPRPIPTGRQAPFVDLNPPPAWAAKTRAGQPGRMTPRPPPPQRRRRSAPGLDDALEIALPGPLTPGRNTTVDPATHGPGQFLQGSFSNDAGTRNYRLYVPASRRPVRVRWS
jgi:hypothetical protein